MGPRRPLKALRRPGSDYRYYRRADLEPFRLEYRRAEEVAATGGDSIIFATANADIEANAALRDPQRDAHQAVREHFATDSSPAIVQIPVGCLARCKARSKGRAHPGSWRPPWECS